MSVFLSFTLYCGLLFYFLASCKKTGPKRANLQTRSKSRSVPERSFCTLTTALPTQNTMIPTIQPVNINANNPQPAAKVKVVEPKLLLASKVNKKQIVSTQTAIIPKKRLVPKQIENKPDNAKPTKNKPVSKEDWSKKQKKAKPLIKPSHNVSIDKPPKTGQIRNKRTVDTQNTVGLSDYDINLRTAEVVLSGVKIKDDTGINMSEEEDNSDDTLRNLTSLENDEKNPPTIE